MTTRLLACLLLFGTAASASAETLTTTFAGGNSNNGIMFDVVADKPLSVSAIQFSSDIANAGSLEIYVKAGTHVGSETTAGHWNLLTIAPYAAGPEETAKAPIALPSPIPVQPGERIAFYLRQTAGSLAYTSGDGTGTVEADDGTLRILEGTGMNDLFVGTNANRIPNVTLHYSRTPGSLTTTFIGGNNHRGIMFDVTAQNAVNLSAIQFLMLNAGTHSVSVYTRLGSHVGVEENESAWTLVGIQSVTIPAPGNQTTFRFDFPALLPVPRGGTRAFYLHAPAPGSMRYSNGGPEGVGNVEASDSNLRILKGRNLSAFFGGGGSPRVPNVSIHYRDADRLAPKITIAGPKRIRTTGSRTKIYGVASDDVAVERVQAKFKRLKGKKLGRTVTQRLRVQSSGLFMLNLKLAPGRNQATFQARDRSGRNSAPVRVTVIR